MSPEKDWVDVMSALLMPTIAIVGTVLAILSYKLARRKRKDELFDKRYEFYKKVENIWLSTGVGAGENDCPYFDWEDIEPWAHEAEFLFDQEVADYLRSLANKEHNGHPNLHDPDFSKHFYKYLKFEK